MTRGRPKLCHPCSPNGAGSWASLFIALLFAFYVNYIPAHLATEPHFGGDLSSAAHAAFHHAFAGAEDGEGPHQDQEQRPHQHSGRDHHDPHGAVDHTLTLRSTAKASSDPALLSFFLPALTAVFVGESSAPSRVPIFELLRPPGDPPPDPQQPRAPPVS